MAIYLKKIFIGAGIVACIMFILLAATVFYLKSDHALGVALSKINNRIPGSVLAEHHEVSFLKGEFGLQGLTLKNSFGDNLVGCEYFRVNISFIPLLKGELLITELILENPRTTLKTDKDGRINLINIFKDPGSVSKRDNDHGKKKKGIPLNIVIKSFTLVKGDFHYEMAKKDLVSALLDVNILANGDLQGQSGEILLNVKESYLKNQKFNINLTKPLKIQGTLNNGNIDPLLIQIGTAHSEIKVSGKIQDIFSKPVVDLQADLNLSLKEIQESLSRKPKLLGQVKGQLIVSGNIGEPSANLGLNIEEGIFFENTISQLTLDLKLDNYLIICDALKFNTMGSFVNLTGNIELAKVFPNGYLSSRNFFEELEYHASIKQENAQLEKLPWLKKRLKGTINAEIDIKGRGFSPDSLDAAGNLRLIARNIRADKIVSPVDAELETAIMIENGFLTIDCFDMRADKIRLDAAGSIDLKTRHIDSKLKIDAPDLETPLSAIGIKGVKGSVFLNADVTGGLENPLLDIMATGDNLSIPHVKIGDVVATGSFAGGKFKIEHALFQNNKSRLNIKGAVQIFEQDTLTVRKNPEFQVNISESTVFLEDLLDKVRGKIILSGHVSGSKEKPTGTLLLAGENIDLGVQVFSTVHLNLLLDEQKLWVTSMQAGISKNKTMEATGWLSLEKEYQIDLKSKGIALKEIDWIHDKSFLDGMLEFDFSGKGSIDDPQLRGDIFLTDFSVQGEELDDFHVHLDVKDHVAVVSGKIDADLKGVLDLADKEFTIDIECLDTDLAPYLNMFKMYNYSGLLSGKVQVKGNVNHLDRIQTAADISKFQIFNDSLKIADANPFRFFYTDKVVSIPGAKIFLLNDGQIEINGSADLDGPLSLKAHGRIPLHVLALFVEELPDIKGDVVVNAGMTGTIKKPDVKADLKISGLEFTIPELYQKLYNGDGTIHLTKETITIDEFKGKIDSGEFDLSGRIHIDEFKPVYLDVNLHANALPIHAPDTMDLLLTTDVNIKGTDEACVAKGEVILLEGLYYKDIKIKPLYLLKNAAKKNVRKFRCHLKLQYRF